MEGSKELYNQYLITLSFVERRYKDAWDKGDMEEYNYFWGQWTALDTVLIDMRMRGVSYV